MKALTSIGICRLFCGASKMRAKIQSRWPQNRGEKVKRKTFRPKHFQLTRKNKAAVSLDFARAMCYTQSCMNGIFVCSG